jgi:hypothetical protein
MIRFEQKGDFSKLERYLKKVKNTNIEAVLHKYGQKGVKALSAATPVESGLTARSWYYEIENTRNQIAINFYNSNVQNGVPIAVIIQHGHGTGSGGWVQGRDYINPAIQPIFDEITKDVWREVTEL